MHHDISLFSFIREKDEIAFKDNLSFCKRVVTVLRGPVRQFRYVYSSIVGKYPLLLASYDNALMRQKIQLELDNAAATGKPYDLIHIEPGYVWPSLPAKHPPVVVAEHNIEHSVYQLYVDHVRLKLLKPFMQRDVNKLRYWEELIWSKADHIVTVAEKDSEVICRRYPNAHISVVSNGVNANHFLYKPQRFVKDCTCLYVGNFRWIQNIQAVSFLLDSVWPTIKKEFPGATLRIVGGNMPPQLKRKITSLDVTLVDTVSDIKSEYNRAHVLLAPIQVGGGTKYKIFEAMASGLPVITSRLGSHGIGENVVYTAEEPTEYVERMNALADWKILERKLRIARKLVEDEYTWERIAASLEKAWRQTYDANH